MTEHIFISYSRKDIDVASKIVQTLAENNLDTWIDWKSIPKGEDWWAHIESGIEEANVFLFLISRNSVASAVCNEEIDHAVKNGKRILPILIQEIDPQKVPKAVSKLNWIFYRPEQDDFDAAIQQVHMTIHTDYDWLNYHTAVQVKAINWKKRKNDKSRLLRGKELEEANAQFTKVTIKTDPQPTPLQLAFIETSQQDAKRISLVRRSFGSAFLVVGLIMCCALCGVIAASAVLFDRTPAKVNVDGHLVEIRNRFNYRFFEEDVGSGIKTYAEPIKLTPNSGYVFVIGTDSDGEKPGQILAYDMSGNLLWSHDANSDPYNGPTANFHIEKIIVEPVLNNGEQQIIYTSQKTDWFPSELGLLSADGELLSNYWNPGFIYNVQLVDFDEDDNQEIVVLAVNNHLGMILVNSEVEHPTTVYVLSPKLGFNGQAYPMVIPGIPTGVEYNNWIAVLDPYEARGGELAIVQEDGTNLIEVKLLPNSGYIYLRDTGEIQRYGLSDHWQGEKGDASPGEYICFLSKFPDGKWNFSPWVGNGDWCPWFVSKGE